MNICNTEKLIFPGICHIIPGSVLKSLDNLGIPGWLVSMLVVMRLSELVSKTVSTV